jgi:hypothetical protein
MRASIVDELKGRTAAMSEGFHAGAIAGRIRPIRFAQGDSYLCASSIRSKTMSRTTKTPPSGAGAPAPKPRRVEQESRERALEIGLEDTFPASDPVAVIEPGPSTAPPSDAPQR